MKERCLTYDGMVCHGISPKDSKPEVKLSTFMKEMHQHMIVNGMCEMFLHNDGTNKCNLFQQHSGVMVEVISHHWDDLLNAAPNVNAADKCVTKNLECGVACIHDAISQDL